jgi:hypothetical protein
LRGGNKKYFTISVHLIFGLIRGDGFCQERFYKRRDFARRDKIPPGKAPPLTRSLLAKPLLLLSPSWQSHSSYKIPPGKALLLQDPSWQSPPLTKSLEGLCQEGSCKRRGFARMDLVRGGALPGGIL